ncbi:uncharacterized protein LOC110845789 isoform X2 [Folsomia candida]|uniref:uncharacterized protein LOC110845789 isoform X2 n=1 Tax=Folsomia candida TaxID=158441 RepID=UPI001604C3CA|nr:uncharacterized protein LOC110845789 isoform X2 [Folsomia candida]
MSKDWRRSKTQSNSNSFDGGGSGSSNGSGGGLFFGVEDDDEDSSSSSSSSDEEAGFFVRIENIMGGKFQVYAYASDSVELLKTRIAFQEGIPQKEQNLFLSHGRIPLDNPSVLLADLGFNEISSKSKPIRLITNISSGLGSKTFSSHDPPPPFPSLPRIPRPLSSRRKGDEGENPTERTSHAQQGQEPVRLPRLDDNSIDGVLVFKDRDRRVFVIIKKVSNEESLGLPPPSHPSSNLIRGRKSTATMTGFEEPAERSRNSLLTPLEDGIRRRGDLGSGRRESIIREPQKQLERIRENAKTLQKMTQIRADMSMKKRIPLNPNCDDRQFFRHNNERENQLPDINETQNYKNYNSSSTFRDESSHKETSSCTASLKLKSSDSKTKITTHTTFNRTITSSVSELNRLKAELYLEAKRTGGGTFGILPYTNNQLVRYVQLKVKVLLADQNPEEYDYLSRHKFVLVPTVVARRQQQENIMTLNSAVRRHNDTGKGGLRSSNITGFTTRRKRNSSSDSTNSSASSNISILKEQNHIITRLTTARKLKSDESIKSGGRLRKQQSQSRQPSGGTTVRNILSAGRRSTSGSNLGTSSTIQKKKKDIVRCAECRKRIGVACRYQCRCGKLFCSTHRYAETHNCSYDYKSEGRRQLQEANPLIVANKVDKI